MRRPFLTLAAAIVLVGGAVAAGFEGTGGREGTLGVVVLYKNWGITGLSCVSPTQCAISLARPGPGILELIQGRRFFFSPPMQERVEQISCDASGCFGLLNGTFVQGWGVEEVPWGAGSPQPWLFHSSLDETTGAFQCWSQVGCELTGAPNYQAAVFQAPASIYPVALTGSFPIMSSYTLACWQPLRCVDGGYVLASSEGGASEMVPALIRTDEEAGSLSTPDFAGFFSAAGCVPVGYLLCVVGGSALEGGAFIALVTPSGITYHLIGGGEPTAIGCSAAGFCLMAQAGPPPQFREIDVIKGLVSGPLSVASSGFFSAVTCFSTKECRAVLKQQPVAQDEVISFKLAGFGSFAPLPAPPPPTVVPPPEHSLDVFGDSNALTLGIALSGVAGLYGYRVLVHAFIGCGVMGQGVRMIEGESLGGSLGYCDTWQAAYRQDLKADHPDLCFLLVGRWETADEVLPDAASVHIGEPAYDHLLASDLASAAQILSEGCKEAMLSQAPYFFGAWMKPGIYWPEENPARTKLFNAILTGAVASQHLPNVSVFRIDDLVGSMGHFVWTKGGYLLRDSDGVHFAAGAAVLLAPHLLKGPQQTTS